jgi:hypothetical protein
MSNDTIFIITVVASFGTGIAVTLFTINWFYLLKHRPRFNRRQRQYLYAMNHSPYIKSKQK